MKRSLQRLCGLFLLAALTLACRFSLPTQAGSQKTLATSVTATFTAMAAQSQPLVLTNTPAAATPVTGVATEHLKTVAYVSSSKNLYVWQENQKALVQLTTSADVTSSAVSPDGSLIAFMRSTDMLHFELDLIHEDGTGQTTLLSSSDLDALPRPADSETSIPYQIIWKPNTHLLFMNVRIQYMGPGLSVASPLYVINTDTGEKTTLLNVSGNWQFNFSPDGNFLVVSRAEGIDLYTGFGDLILSNVVTHPAINTASEYQWTATPDWKADSSAFAVAIPPQDPFASSPEDSKAYIVDSSGKTTLLISKNMTFSSGQIASFNHALTQVSFSVPLQPASSNTWELHLSKLDGSDDHTLTRGYFSTAPIWAPDDQHFLYSISDGTTQQSFVSDVNGTSTLIPNISNLMSARWLDSQRYLATVFDGTNYLFLLGSVNGTPQTLFSEPSLESGQWASFDVN